MRNQRITYRIETAKKEGNLGKKSTTKGTSKRTGMKEGEVGTTAGTRLA